MTFPELSASDDSSLSDGLLLEEGERGSLGTFVRAGLLEDGGLWQSSLVRTSSGEWRLSELVKAGVPGWAQGLHSCLMLISMCPCACSSEGGDALTLSHSRSSIILTGKEKVNSSRAYKIWDVHAFALGHYFNMHLSDPKSHLATIIALFD